MCAFKLGKTKNVTFSIIKAYCELKWGKVAESKETLKEASSVREHRDPTVCLYLVRLWTHFGESVKALKFLQNVEANFYMHEEVQKHLFYSYVRAGKLMKQQSQSLELYKRFTNPQYAEWSIESMFLLFRTR
jgi:tetratricopeptide (TPR) repeat protein